MEGGGNKRRVGRGSERRNRKTEVKYWIQVVRQRKNREGKRRSNGRYVAGVVTKAKGLVWQCFVGLCLATVPALVVRMVSTTLVQLGQEGAV